MLSTTGPRGTPLLASTFMLKFLQALWRDVILRLRQLGRRYSYARRRTVSFFTFVFCAVIILSSSLFFNWPLRNYTSNGPSHSENGSNLHVRHAGLSVKRLECLCMKHDDGVDFAHAFLTDAAFVARVRFEFTFSASIRGETSLANSATPRSSRIGTEKVLENVSEFSAVTVLKGPLGSATQRILLRNSFARACVRDGRLLRPFFPPTADWLVISGTLVNASDHLSINTRLHEDVSLLPQLRLPPLCSRTSRTRRTSTYEAVRLYPWHSLPIHVRNHLLNPPVATRFSAAAWWRASALVQHAPTVEYIGKGSSLHRTIIDEPVWTGGHQWWIRDGLSILAACKDRSETVDRALESWLKVQEVDEVILVDWTSTVPIAQTLPNDLLSDVRLSIIRVEGQVDWVLTRAYNVALQVASRSTTLKVDCDTWIAPDFVNSHSLSGDAFYAGDWTSIDAGPSNALHSNGILYASRSDLLSVGGYDERIVTYGWDDTDIVLRLSRIRTRKVLHYDKVRHIPHDANLRAVSQKSRTLLPPSHPFAAAVEVQRNRLLSTRYGLPEWGARSLRTVWNAGRLSTPTNRAHSPDVRMQRMNAANHIPTLTDLVSASDLIDVEKRAVRLILNRYGVPMLPKLLSLSFYKDYITRVAFPSRFAQLTVSVQGGCVARIIALAALRLHTTNVSLTDIEHIDDHRPRLNPEFIDPPSPYTGWRTLSVWTPVGTECKCQHVDIVHAVEEAVISVWGDVSNPLPPATQAHMDVRKLLAQYETLAKPVNATERTARWLQGNLNGEGETSLPLSLVTNVRCGIAASVDLSTSQISALRNSLRAVIPQAAVVSLVAKSLDRRALHVLDMNTFSARGAALVLETQLVERIEAIFNTSEIEDMATSWGVEKRTGVVDKERADAAMARKLRYRARSVAFAVAMSESTEGSQRLSNHRTLQLIVHVKKKAESLLLGCPGSHAQLLYSVPEVAVVVAAILSSDVRH